MITEEYAWDRFVPTPEKAPRPVHLVDAPPASAELAVVERSLGVVAQPAHSAEVVVLDQASSVPGPSIDPWTRDQRSSFADYEVYAPSPIPSSRLEVSPVGSINMVTDNRPARTSVAEVTGDTFYVDLNAIAEAVKEAQANAGQPVDESKRIYVGKEGELLQGSEVTGTERVAEVTGDTFYVNPDSISQVRRPSDGAMGNPHPRDLELDVIAELIKIVRSWQTEGRHALSSKRPVAGERGETIILDLGAIAEAVKEAQANGGQPVEESKRIYVNKEGELCQGSEVTGENRLAEVAGDTFYATRLEDETEFVRNHMPVNTRRTSDGTFDGWYFAITNEFGDTYGLFLYFHKGMGVYRVALVEPRLEGKADAHGGHLWADGHLCLTKRDGSGYKSIETTYAKAALWTRGMSCYRRGYGFQFNIGQD